jgi:hypothetical protein
MPPNAHGAPGNQRAVQELTVNMRRWPMGRACLCGAPLAPTRYAPRKWCSRRCRYLYRQAWWRRRYPENRAAVGRQNVSRRWKKEDP